MNHEVKNVIILVLTVACVCLAYELKMEKDYIAEEMDVPVTLADYAKCKE